MKKIITLSLCFCFSLSTSLAQESTEKLRNKGFENDSDAIEQLCMLYASKQIPLDQEYMFWLIKWHEFEGECAPSLYLLGAAYVNGIPALKVERNYPKALYYYQDYSFFRPGTSDENEYHWWEDTATMEKLSALWDRGYEPEPGNESKGQLLIVPESVKVSNIEISKGTTEYITLSVKNIGKGDVDFALVIADIVGGASTYTIPTVSIPIIRPGVTVPVVIPFSVDSTFSSGQKTVNVRISDPRGRDSDSSKMTIVIK